MKRVAIGVVVVLAALLAAILAFAWFGNYNPEPEEPVAVGCTGSPPEIQVGIPFRVISWNVRQGASRRRPLPDEGGTPTTVPLDEVQQTLATITAALENEAAQIYLLQEVDRASRRTHHIDQLDHYLTFATDRCHAAAPYHRSRYALGSGGNRIGPVDMELALLTQVAIESAKRIQLPLLDETWILRQFDIKPALLVAEIPVAGLDTPMAVAVTHLSAPPQESEGLDDQIAALDQWMGSRPEGQPWILAGDLNLLPSQGASRSTSDPIARLLSKYTEVLGDQTAPSNRTFLPFGAREPDRKIDYAFVGGPIEVRSARVLREYAEVSGHLPIRAELVVNGSVATDAGETAPVEKSPVEALPTP
jgi:endonuclease/exonuclease/phosphatase family metal-dependent hydrolase